MLQEEAILLQNQDSYRLPQYIENPRYGPATSLQVTLTWELFIPLRYALCLATTSGGRLVSGCLAAAGGSASPGAEGAVGDMKSAGNHQKFSVKALVCIGCSYGA